MFIKFGDNTKKIIVKKSKEKSENVDSQETNVEGIKKTLDNLYLSDLDKF